MAMDIYKTIHDFLRTQPIFKAYVFGSYSRSEEKEDSDIDILLELEDHVDLYQFILIKIELERLLKKNVDLVSNNGLSPRLKPYIDKEKILIYEK